MAIYGAVVIAGDLKSVGASISKFGLVQWATVLGLSLVNYGLRFVRWELFLLRLNSRVPVHLSLAYYLGGFAFTTTPGKVGETLRSVYLKRHGVPFVKSLAAFISERLVDLATIALLATAAAWTFPEYRWFVLITATLIVTSFALLHAESKHSVVEALIRLLPSQRLRTIGPRMQDLLRASSTLLRGRTLYVGILLSLIAWGAEGVALCVIMETLNIDGSLGVAVSIYSVSLLAGAASFIPGGLGTTEAVMIILLKLIGADTPTAVAATLICRLTTLWFAVVIGGVAIAAIEIRNRAAH